MAIQNADRDELKKLILEVLQENPTLIKNAIEKSSPEEKSITIENYSSDKIIDAIFNEFEDVLKALAWSVMFQKIKLLK